jgi:hypothetical protein
VITMFSGVRGFFARHDGATFRAPSGAGLMDQLAQARVADSTTIRFGFDDHTSYIQWPSLRLARAGLSVVPRVAAEIKREAHEFRHAEILIAGYQRARPERDASNKPPKRFR